MEQVRNVVVRGMAGGDPTEKRDPASEQLAEYASLAGKMQATGLHNPPATELDKNTHGKTFTLSNGMPVGDMFHSMTVGPRGPVLFQDIAMFEVNAQFNRQRPAERPVHSKGAGAFGVFKCTHDISDVTKMLPFASVGKETHVFTRFSTVQLERASSDLVRDVRGFAVKFYTEQGNWDLVGNNMPVFWVRDSLLFPEVNKCQQRNPATNLRDNDAFWDFMSLRPETLHLITMIHTGRGIPCGFRHMHGFGVNTFKLVNAAGQGCWAKFHWVSDQGIKNMPTDQAARISGEDPDFSVRDLWDAIARGDNPSWGLFIQTMSFEDALKVPFNPFDATKVWPHKEFPLRPVGKMTLNSNPRNFHAEVEQSAFCPGNLIPGVEPSPDKILAGRLLTYTDAQRFRIGPNFNQIPVNCPFLSGVYNYELHGPMRVDNNRGGQPGHFPNSFGGPMPDPKLRDHVMHVSGNIDRYNDDDDDNYSQARILFERVLTAAERETLTDNLAGGLSKAAKFIRDRMVEQLTKVHPEYGRMVQEKIDKFAAAKKELGEGGVLSKMAADIRAADAAVGFKPEPTKTINDEHGKEFGVVHGPQAGMFEEKPDAHKTG